jgi:hypothetical protein
MWPQQSRAHHRRERQRDDRREQDRDRQRDRELAEQPADDVAHEQERDQHGDERHRQRDDGEADLLRTLERRLQRRLALLDVAVDVLDHHDGVVDDEARGDRQRHQRQVVDREPGQVHDRERADQRQRHRHARNERRRHVAQEDEDDHHDERDGEQQLELHVVHRRADRHGPVGQHHDVDGGGQRRGELRQQALDAIHDLDDVRPGCRWMLMITAAESFAHAASRVFSALSMTSATSTSRTGAPLR